MSEAKINKFAVNLLDYIESNSDAFDVHHELSIGRKAVGNYRPSERTAIGESPQVVADYFGCALDRFGRKDETSEGHKLFRSLSDVAASLGWVVGYGSDVVDEEFQRRFAYTEVALGQSESSSVCLGITLIAPETFYDWHSHPAVETYACLSSRSEWGLNYQPLVEKSVGDVILHPSNAAHAMRTGDEPLLAPWIWTGNIDVPAKMT